MEDYELSEFNYYKNGLESCQRELTRLRGVIRNIADAYESFFAEIDTKKLMEQKACLVELQELQPCFFEPLEGILNMMDRAQDICEKELNMQFK